MGGGGVPYRIIRSEHPVYHVEIITEKDLETKVYARDKLKKEQPQLSRTKPTQKAKITPGISNTEQNNKMTVIQLGQRTRGGGCSTGTETKRQCQIQIASLSAAAYSLQARACTCFICDMNSMQTKCSEIDIDNYCTYPFL